MRSRYCTTLQIPAGGEAQRLTYSSLSGNIALVDELCDALLDHASADLRREELVPAELAQVDERLAFLADRGFWIEEPGQDDALADRLATSIGKLRRELLQFLFVFHPEEESAAAGTAVDQAVAAVPALIARFAPRRCHFHFWVFTPFHAELFHHAVERLLAVLPPGTTGITGATGAPGEPAGEGPQVNFVVNTHGLLPLDVRPLRLRFGMNVVMKVAVDRHFIARCASLEDYLQALYTFLDQTAAQGQASSLFLNANRGTEELFRDVLLERFMERGLNRAVVTRYYLSAVTPKTDLVDFHCDMDSADWGLWQDLLVQTASRPRYRMFTLYGGGIVPRFQSLLNFKKTLRPDIHYCPLVANAIAFDLAGNLWVCPKTAFQDHDGPGSAPVGRYAPTLEIAEDRLRAWWDWNVRQLPGCRECPDAFICSGGCPLAAMRQGGPSGPHEERCQPVQEFLSTGVRENLVHLSRTFGPGVRSRS